MKNTFDSRLELFNGHNAPIEITDAAIFVRDTLWLAEAAAESLFESKDPILVFKVFDRIVERIADQRRADALKKPSEE